MAFKVANSRVTIPGMITLALLIFLSSLVSPTSSAKLSRSSHHHESRGEDSSLETLLLRDKLNLILDAESREVTLLKNLLDESREENNGHSYTFSPGAADATGEKNELDKSHKSQSDSWETGTTPRTTTNTATWSTTTPTTTSTPYPEKVAGSGSENLHSLAYLREHGIVNKLEENSKRMEKMVVFLVDLRNLLTEALTSQNREMAFESEMVEIREEMEYLRKELHTLKKDRAEGTGRMHSKSGDGPNNDNLENKLHNDEATIEWLKGSTKELRSQMQEISESCNMTVLVQMKEQLDRETGRRSTDLAAAQKELEILRMKQLAQDEQASEAKADIEDLRNWQVKMGQKLIEGQSLTGKSELGSNNDNDESLEEKTNSVEFGEERFITEALKESVGKPLRHNKRLKAKVHELQSIIQDLVKDNKNYHKRLMKIENSQRSLKSMTSNIKDSLSQAGLISSSSSPGTTNPNENYRSRRHTNVNDIDNGSSGSVGLKKRMGSLEKTMQEYIITLENLNDKVGAVEELQESSTQLFRALETLERKYDDRGTELQTGLARLESSVSSMHVVNEDLKEQQTQQSSLIQSVKKTLFETKGQLQTNHLRLASIQSQLVKWASQKCSDENSESIQNIRIATLEHAVLDAAERLPSSTSTNFS